MIKRLSPFFLLMHISLVAGCSNSVVEPSATYRVFRQDDNGREIELVATNDKYHCKKGDNIIIRFQYIGPYKEFLDWEATATNLEKGNLENDYSTPDNTPLSQQHTFIAKKSGNFAITFITFLARKNIPMRTYKEWNSVRTEGKIILVVEE